jgi:hypothetical protein
VKDAAVAKVEAELARLWTQWESAPTKAAA